MLRSYASLRHFQEGWSSLHRLFRVPRNAYRELALRTGRLGNLWVRITPKMCSKIFKSPRTAEVGLAMIHRETFIPQSYVWGGEAQVDWYEAFRLLPDGSEFPE